LPEPTANLGEEASCVLLIPMLRAASTQILSLADHPDGSTLDINALRAAISDMKSAKRHVPADMASDIDGQLELMEKVDAISKGETGSGRIEFGGFRDSGMRLTLRCAKYAR